MTSRERVVRALGFEPTDRIPLDLGGMKSTGISAFAYPSLVAALGLPPRRPRIHDTGQMLALPDLDVLDALGVDVVTVDWGLTNAFPQPELWHDTGFHGRLAAQVQDPADFIERPGGLMGRRDGRIMPPASFVFNAEHSGQPLDLDGPLPLIDLDAFRRNTEANAPTDGKYREARDFYRRVRSSTDKAVFCADWFRTGIGISGYAGIAMFPMICLEEPGHVREYHEIMTRAAVKTVREFLPEIRDCVDVIMVAADDWGTQQSTVASPDMYRELFLPYFKRINDEIHRIAPEARIFIHTCGAVYSLLDAFVESGFDIINPVQWPAGGHSYKEWKDRVRGKATLWGGGVDAQHTLSLGTVAQVEQQAREVCSYMKQGGGYVFCNIHNLLAEVPPEKILAMYRAARES